MSLTYSSERVESRAELMKVRRDTSCVLRVARDTCLSGMVFIDSARVRSNREVLDHN